MKIKNILLACITGIGIGMPIAAACMIIIGGFSEATKEVLCWVIASALYGVLSLVFANTKLSLPIATIIHCIGCLGVTCGACMIIGYTDSFTELLLAVLPVFVVVYVVLYLVTYFGARKQAKLINEELENKN